MSKFLPDELEDLLRKNGISFKKKSRSFLLQCPRCGKNDKLWILRKNGAFVCWYCKETEGFKGWAPAAISEILGRPKEEIRNLLYEGGTPTGALLDFELVDDGDLIDIDVIEIPEIDWPWDSVEIAQGYKGLNYLESRGIHMHTAVRYALRFWPSQQRVLFPVTFQGKLVGYQGRSIVPGKEPKILTSAGLRREYVVMFEHNLLTSKHAVVCEGPVDAIKADLCGGNVATMGKAVSKHQLALIRSHGITNVYLALDPDAVDEIARLTYELGDLKLRLLLPPNGRKDLGDCSMEEVWEQFQRAETVTAGHLIFDLKPGRFA